MVEFSTEQQRLHFTGGKGSGDDGGSRYNPSIIAQDSNIMTFKTLLFLIICMLWLTDKVAPRKNVDHLELARQQYFV